MTEGTDANDGSCIGDTEREELAIVYCGGCEARSLKTDTENVVHAALGPDEPHCPRCGTRLSYEDTKVEHWVNRSVGADTDREGDE